MKTHVYPRHKSHCPHRVKPVHRRCKCPKWIYVERTRQRIPAKTRSWEVAEKKAQLMASEETATPANDDKRKQVAALEADEEKTSIGEAATEPR